MQRAEPGTSRQVGPLRARLVALGEGRAAGDHRHRAGGRGVIAGPARILEGAADAREGEPARLQRLDRVHQALYRVVERVVGGGGEEIEACRHQLVQHPGRRTEMRATALQRRIAAIIVGQPLEIGEGNVGRPHLVEQRPELGVVAAVEPALQDRIAGEQEGKGHARTVRGRAGACQLADWSSLAERLLDPGSCAVAWSPTRGTIARTRTGFAASTKPRRTATRPRPPHRPWSRR